MIRKGKLLLFGAIAVALAETSLAQRPSNWRAYRMADGLPESACLNVTVAQNGKIVTRHLSPGSLSEVDGFNVTVQPAPTGRGRIYESPGGQLWTVSPEGLQEFREGGWIAHALPELSAEFRAAGARPGDSIPLYPVRQGLVLIALADSLIEFNEDTAERPHTTVLRRADQTKLKKFTGMIAARDGGLWVSGMAGLAKIPAPARNLRPDSEWQEFSAPSSPELVNLREPHESAEGVVTVVAEAAANHQKVIARFDGQHWTIAAAGTEEIRQSWQGPDGTCWAITRNALLQADNAGIELAENDDIAARQYYDVAVEPSGNFWLATSDGLFHYSALTWRSARAVKGLNSLVHCLAGDKPGQLWFVAGNVLHSLLGEKRQDFPFPEELGRRLQGARALFPLNDGTILLDTESGCFKFNPAFGKFTPVSTKGSNGKLRSLGQLKDGNLCVQSCEATVGGGPCKLESYDGLRFEPFAGAPAEGVFNVLFAAQNGDLWLAGEQGMAWRHENKWKTFVASDKSSPEGVVCFTETVDGKVWCAGQDRIWEFDGRSWIVARRGFDRINDMLRTREGSIWVASNSGVHRFYQGAWIENGIEEGLPSVAVRELYENENGLWAGTTRGLSLYHPEADPDPPQTRLQEFKEADKNIPEGGTITITFTGQDKWKYTPRSRLLYSGRLDDREWTSFQEVNGISLTEPPGKHVFQVRAMDRNCRLELEPARLEFVVVVPWYKESRLMVIAVAGSAVALFFAGLAINRHRQLVRSYAEVEKKVAERTRELQIANRELMHSQKMTALGTLAAGIAHDFNNILSIIKGSAQIIEDNLDNPAKVTTRLERIKTVVEQGAGIVKAMLGFSRESDEQIVLCDLNNVAQDTIKLLGDRFLREVQVSFEPAANLPPAPGSKDFIQQILLNFIFNAAESMAKRKQVMLTAGRSDKLPAGTVLAPAQSQEYAFISVRDFGCGIPPENMPRIFEPFFTTKAFSVRRGTGLGLSMVYELAKKMEAGLAVESIVDQGSTFTLILPVKEQPARGPKENLERKLDMAT